MLTESRLVVSGGVVARRDARSKSLHLIRVDPLDPFNPCTFVFYIAEDTEDAEEMQAFDPR